MDNHTTDNNIIDKRANERIRAIEQIPNVSKTDKNKRNLMALQNLKKREINRRAYTAKVKKIQEKPEAERSEENKAFLAEKERYNAAETKRTDRSECIFNMLTEVEKKEVVSKMTALVNSFSDKRKEGEALGFIAPVGTAAVTVTTGSIATLATMGAVVATGPFAIPITVGLVAIGAIVGFYLRQKALNEELQGNLIAIKGEVERFYFIYKVIEQIAKEKNLNLNTALVRKFTILLTNNILTVAGPEVFALLKKAVNENPYALFTPDQMGPLKSLNSLNALTKKREDRPTLLSRLFTPSVQRLVIPAELLRIIIRDVTILSIFFTIMQSEFDLLLREYDAKQKKKLLDVLLADSSLSGPVKDAFGKYFKEDTWLDSDEYFRFKCNLPFNNLDLLHDSDKELIGTLQLEASAPVPSVEEVYDSNANSNKESAASDPSTASAASNPSAGMPNTPLR